MTAPVFPPNVSLPLRKTCHKIGSVARGVSPDCKMCVRDTKCSLDLENIEQ